MSDAPKIVHDRLRAAVPGEAHPDADVLTAFAEQALSGGEREGVMRHLARCGDCREVVALSLPPLEPAAQPQAITERISPSRASDRPQSWFAWPNLRWAALAASVVVVGSVLLLHPGQKADTTLGTENLSAQGHAQSPSLDAKSNSVAAPPAELTASTAGTPAAKADIAPAPERRSGSFGRQALGRVQNGNVTASASLADKKSLDSNESKRHDSVDGAKLAMQVPTAPVADKIEIATANRAAAPSERVEVSGSAVTVESSAPAAGGLVARNEALAPPIAKAKPAVKEEVAGLKSQALGAQPAGAFEVSDSTLARQKQFSKVAKDDAIPQWSLAQGKLRRSLDTGKSWQPVLQPQIPLLSFGARGNDVWAGGHNGMLFHSIDAGQTWTMLQPATKVAALSGDIVSIDIRSATDVVLSTNSGESWTTGDGGKTWGKK